MAVPLGMRLADLYPKGFTVGREASGANGKDWALTLISASDDNHKVCPFKRSSTMRRAAE
jgi:hypothetical protein